MNEQTAHPAISELTDKQLRTLRNNLNNRLSAFAGAGEGGAKDLQKSHRLFGLAEGQCKALLADVQKEMKARVKK